MMQVEEKPDVTYSDVGGCKEQIDKLREVVETPLLHPERFVNLGIEPPKGVLLYGPPGTGKTLCARAVANRTDACFIRVIGSELVQKVISIKVINLGCSEATPSATQFSNDLTKLAILPDYKCKNWTFKVNFLCHKSS